MKEKATNIMIFVVIWVFVSSLCVVMALDDFRPWRPHTLAGWILLFVLAAPLTVLFYALGEYVFISIETFLFGKPRRRRSPTWEDRENDTKFVKKLVIFTAAFIILSPFIFYYVMKTSERIGH